MSTKSYKSFERTLERASALLDAQKIVTQQKGRPPWFLSDILRASLVMIMAALDSYIHDVIQERVYVYLFQSKGKNLQKKLLDVLREAIPYERIFEVWFADRPKVHIATAIRKRNAERTFMKPDKIEEALKMVGINDVWKIAANKFKRRRDGIKTLFGKYAERRDKIAHEGDAFRVTRAKGKLRSIRRPYVEDCLSNVGRLVKIIEENL